MKRSTLKAKSETKEAKWVVTSRAGGLGLRETSLTVGLLTRPASDPDLSLVFLYLRFDHFLLRF